ncbi:restriction endonuclease subunit S [Levilactobacillus senmaizukei]|uniref:restriction endonuclease subunit S n=1 Tax=Levilactobacillus senmaizukei TaxID=431273 RepID=UPI0009EB66AB|nr:restriction endonuclease subunit S [Levilactobacillus senmaizukei]
MTWEQRKLGSLLQVHSGRDYKELGNGTIPVYGTGGYLTSVDSCLSETDAIGLGRKGTINKPQFLEGPFWTVDTLFYMTPNRKMNLYFLFTLVSKVNWLRYDESTGVPSLSKSTIEAVLVHTPEYEEQLKIGVLSHHVDSLIAANERQRVLIKKGSIEIMQLTIINIL